MLLYNKIEYLINDFLGLMFYWTNGILIMGSSRTGANLFTLQRRSQDLAVI